MRSLRPVETPRNGGLEEQADESMQGHDGQSHPGSNPNHEATTWESPPTARQQPSHHGCHTSFVVSVERSSTGRAFNADSTESLQVVQPEVEVVRSMEIRSATVGDTSEIEALVATLSSELGVGFDRPDLIGATALVMVARVDGGIVGYAHGEIGDGLLVLSAVYVDTAYRGSGLGNRLLDELGRLATARDIGLAEVVVPRLVRSCTGSFRR